MVAVGSADDRRARRQRRVEAPVRRHQRSDRGRRRSRGGPQASRAVQPQPDRVPGATGPVGQQRTQPGPVGAQGVTRVPRSGTGDVRTGSGCAAPRPGRDASRPAPRAEPTPAPAPPARLRSGHADAARQVVGVHHDLHQTDDEEVVGGQRAVLRRHVRRRARRGHRRDQLPAGPCQHLDQLGVPNRGRVGPRRCSGEHEPLVPIDQLADDVGVAQVRSGLGDDVQEDGA